MRPNDRVNRSSVQTDAADCNPDDGWPGEAHSKRLVSPFVIYHSFRPASKIRIDILHE